MQCAGIYGSNVITELGHYTGNCVDVMKEREGVITSITWDTVHDGEGGGVYLGLKYAREKLTTVSHKRSDITEVNKIIVHCNIMRLKNIQV